MHIGVDVRNLTAASITGIARVLVEAVGAMARQGATFTFYWPGSRRASPLDAISGARHVTSVFESSVGKIGWGLAVLPVLVGRAPPDVFWGPAHRLSPLLPARVPAVVTIHDLVWRRFPETMTRRGHLSDRVLMRASIDRANRVVADSQATADDIAAAFGRRDVEVVYPGTTRFAPADSRALFARLGIDGRPYALFVGTLEPRKNLVRLLRAFDHARTGSNADWHLVIAGGKGWRDDAIRETLDPLVAAGHVHVTGFVSDGELAALYSNARFLAMPSLYEGFGLPIVEAQQYGVPALASHQGSLPEATGAGGLLVDPLNEGEIGAAIAQLFVNDDLHTSLAAAAGANAQRFTWDNFATRLLGVFEAARSQVALRGRPRVQSPA